MNGTGAGQPVSAGDRRRHVRASGATRRLSARHVRHDAGMLAARPARAAFLRGHPALPPAEDPELLLKAPPPTPWVPSSYALKTFDAYPNSNILPCLYRYFLFFTVNCKFKQISYHVCTVLL